MKILLLTDNHLPNGGAERYLLELKRRLEKNESLEVYSIGFGQEGLKAIHSKFLKLTWQIIFNPIVFFKLRRIIKQLNPDIIHLHNNKQYSAAVWRAVKGYRVIQTVHDYSYLCPLAQNIHRSGQPCATGLKWSCFWKHRVKYNKLIYLLLVGAFFMNRRAAKKYISHFLAPSPHLEAKMKLNGFSPVSYVQPFIDKIITCETNPLAHRFLFAANLGKHKGTDLLIREFAKAVEQNHRLSLLIAGDGPELKTMRTQAINLNILEHIQFLGWRENLTEFYHQCNAVIFASTGMESFGLVITEAMSHRRPVIGVNFGTSAWLIDDKKTGLLFDPNTEGDLATKILTLADNPQYSLDLGREARRTIDERFDNEKVLSQILSIYQKTSEHPCSLVQSAYSRN